jgi:hypothetical protein
VPRWSANSSSPRSCRRCRVEVMVRRWEITLDTRRACFLRAVWYGWNQLVHAPAGKLSIRQSSEGRGARIKRLGCGSDRRS